MKIEKVRSLGDGIASAAQVCAHIEGGGLACLVAVGCVSVHYSATTIRP